MGGTVYNPGATVHQGVTNHSAWAVAGVDDRASIHTSIHTGGQYFMWGWALTEARMRTGGCHLLAPDGLARLMKNMRSAVKVYDAHLSERKAGVWR